VLVAEDNAINQQVAREILESFGLAVEIVSNGQKAVEALSINAERFDAVLMDVQMPEMDGYEATRVIRTDLNKASLPIIAMTAHALESERQNCLSAGMNDHIAKPIEAELLLATLKRWIKPRTDASFDTATQPAPVSVQPVINPVLPQSLPGIDLPAALARLLGKSDFLLHLLHEFNRTWGGVIEQLRANLAQNYLKEAHRMAHSLRGSAAMLSMTEVAAAAGDLEQALKSDNEERIPVCLQALEKALTPVLAGLAQLPPESPSEPQAATFTPGENPQLAPLLGKLAALLKQNDMEAVECFKSIKTHLGEGEWSPLLNQIDKHLDHFDFENALATLNALSQTLSIPIP
jgi:CheY-like chemotaxis protein